MVVIPKGARNIRFEEVEEAANYIAIQSETTNEYYLNGQWFVIKRALSFKSVVAGDQLVPILRLNSP